MNIVTYNRLVNKYGNPFDKDFSLHNLITINFPYSMFLAWDKKSKVTTTRCHRLISARLLNVLNEIKNTFTPEEIKKLGLDQYGGCYNLRKKRGNTVSLSLHSWGIAIDIDPARNAFKSNRFSMDKRVVAIFKKHGFKWGGDWKVKDAMHFEIGDY